MPNTLTSIIPKVLARGLVVLREQCVMPRLVNGDYSAEAAQKGSTVDVPIPTAKSASDVTPSNTPPAPSDTAITTVQVPLSNWKKADFYLTDNDLHKIDKDKDFVPMEMGEAIRALSNAVNSSIFAEYPGVYGSAGTAGTTPFATTVNAITDVRKVLAKQLCPKQNRRLVLNFDAEANALALAAFADAEKTGSTGVKIEGEIGRKYGFDIFSDDIVPTHTRNALGAGALTVNGVNALGATSVSIAKGAGANWNAVVGDIISIAGHANTYVITANTTVTQGGNTSVPISPGLLQATAGGEAVTSIDTHVVNLAFHRDAFAFANRPLAVTTADLALGHIIMSLTDAQTGISLRLEVSRQYKQTVWEFDILWGVKLVRAALAARMLG